MSAPADASRHISTMDLRARLGDVLDRVRLRFDTFVVERKGEEVAAIVPVERLRRRLPDRDIDRHPPRDPRSPPQAPESQPVRSSLRRCRVA